VSSEDTWPFRPEKVLAVSVNHRLFVKTITV
jgi:hypothetical protein